MISDPGVRIDFDDYVDRYEELLQEQLAFFSSDRGYFSDYKARWAARLMERPPARILEFGCGIGLNLPFLAARFPSSEIFATDISRCSLDHAARSCPLVRVINDEALEDGQFDLVFVAGVFHHVPAGERLDVSRRLVRLLAPGGRLCVFEHNPYNPVTRHLVATCPFDADAVLLASREMRHLLATAGLAVRRHGYCLFFPPRLAQLAGIEPALAWLPLGGQHFVFGGR